MTRVVRGRALLVAATVLVSAASSTCAPRDVPGSGTADALARGDTGAAFQWNLPPGFPPPRVPASNPMTVAKVALGRALFYDRRLSGNLSYSCASCHQQERAFTDGRAHAVGATEQLHPRSTMSLANIAYSASFGWDDPDLVTLEEQAKIPMFNEEPVELGLAGRWPEVIDRLESDQATLSAFVAAFPDAINPVTLQNVSRALAAFERTLVSGRSAYDRLLRDDDRTALTPAARRGSQLFFSERLGCSTCHGGFAFASPTVHALADPEPPTFHNTGLYNLDGKGAYPTDNPGLFRHTHRRRHMGRFRAPTLRNIDLTAPYMHDGSVATLEDAVQHYARGGRLISTGPLAGDGKLSPRKSSLITGFELTASEQADLVAFLKSLTDQTFVEDERFGNPAEPRP